MKIVCGKIKFFILSSLERFKDKENKCLCSGWLGGAVGKTLSCQSEASGSIPAEPNISITYPSIANRIPMRNFCRRCHQSVWMTFVTISSSGLVSCQFKANAPNCLSTHCCELMRVTPKRMHREKTVAEA